MSQQSENLDFSGLFKLDVLVQHDIANHTFYEVGLKKFLALSNNKELVFLYLNTQSERFDTVYDWDFVDNPVYCMCFEPSGTWVLIVSDQKVLLVPFLPLFIPQYTFDCKWSLSSVTVLPLLEIPQPTSVVWWLTKESENIVIISSKSGIITFYSLESQSVVGETRVPGEVLDLQICFDDSLDLLALLISKGPTQQWKMVLEHRSLGYNWLQQIRAQNDRDRKDGFMSYIKQLSKDKITFFTQSGSKDDGKTQTVEYVLKPTEYLPTFRKNSNSWALSAQYVTGRHFLTAFELNEGLIILESPAEDTPSRTLRPNIKKDDTYIQGLWSPKLIYLLKKNKLEIHSAQFSQTQGEVVLGVKSSTTELWSAEVIGDVKRAYLMSAKEPPAITGGWREPTFMCDLQLPRFILEPCLVITSSGAYILNTVSSPCEWLVGLIVRGGACAEQSCAALGAGVPPLLRAAADLLLARGRVAPAHYLYSLSRSPADGWMARLGVFSRLHELSMYQQAGNTPSPGNAAITAKLLALLLKIGTNSEENFDTDVKFTNLSPVEFQELTSTAVSIGLWELAPLFSVHRGHPNLLLNAIKSKNDICRGAIVCLLSQRCLVPILLEENGQWFFDFIAEKCKKFDTVILEHLCLWLNPLQDQLRPVMRDLKQGITSIYSTRMLQLISTFMHIACTIESRNPCLDIHTDMPVQSNTWINTFTPRRSLSCGLGHWAVADDGNAKIMGAETSVNTELIGMVVDVACGRHHTLLLTENGVYASGDNSYGQLGVGSRWAGGAGDAASASGALLRVRHHWLAPPTILAAGHYHSAAVDAGGRLYTWGWGVHGQLCLGSVDDQYTPRLVTKLQGRKVLSVGCGACHTVVLMKNGEVWSCGAGVFGQLAAGNRDKSALPVRVRLGDAVDALAVGYFHNLALSCKGEVWCWGASPQQLRAASARRAPDHDDHDTHLAPQLVHTGNVLGTIVRIAAGWHHSCIIDNTGTLYTWGLNFDGQLGSGDRKQVKIPTKVVIPIENQTESKSPDKNDSVITTKSMVACGGDFTIFIDDNGRIYSTGNTHLQHLCLWLNPLQDQLRPVMRDLKQGITSIYSTRMLQLISTFMHIACTIESRNPCLDIHTDMPVQSNTWINTFTPRRSLSCGLGHWAVADDGNAKIMGAETSVNTELIGMVVDVACGRHHTLLLTENGVYASGDNSYGQLGVGSRWAGGAGDAASASGALLRVRHHWLAPPTILAAGHYHSAAVDAGGRLYTWGWGVHGQLCLGSVDDQYTPRLVTKLQGRKVLSVGCGACHTVVLMKNGEVWSCGAGVFGQLAAGNRDKSALPVRVRLGDAVDALAVGYFHNLALSCKGEVWCWGASPQQLRAASARRAPDHDDHDTHLAPQLVHTGNVLGTIVRIAAGWHHSCIIDNTGTLYTWGLNFDGQLGSGDRKQVKIPTKVVIPIENQTESKSPDKNDSVITTKSMVACGGDFTIFIDDNGRIYSTGNTHLQGNNELEKLNNRIIMMKTTKRVIKIPAVRTNKKFQFQSVDFIDIMFPFDIDDIERKSIEPTLNPLNSISDFQKKSWADNIILLLKPWINEDTLSGNQNMSAKLAYHRNKHSDCLKFMLDNLKCEVQGDKLYLTHHDFGETNKSLKKGELKIVITNIMSKRIKDISLTILNEEGYPVIDSTVYQTLPCCCDELKYTRDQTTPEVLTNITKNLSKEAAAIIDKCISIFPVDSALWEKCFRLAKDFYLENDLMVEELETILRKYMETNATTMAAAIMYSNDCAQYSEILSPKFYLNMCSDILDTWG